MKRILAAILVLGGAWFGAAPASAAEECHLNSCAIATVIPTPQGWSTHFLIRGAGSAAGYDFFNLRILGHPQMDLQGTRHDLNVSVPAGWDGTFSLQACINNFPLDSNCDGWSVFHAELPVASDDRNFCVRYAGHATSEFDASQQQNCGFETASGRWTADNAAHLNWCLGQFRAAGGVPDKLAAARNVANSEDAIRIKDLQACQAKAAAVVDAQKQRAFEIQVTGKNTTQCQQSNQACEARIMATVGPVNAPGVIASECAPYFPVCLANAAAAEQAAREQRAFEIQVTGKTIEQCQQSNQMCETRIRNMLGPINAPAVIAGECLPFFQQCMANAQAALAAAAAGTPPSPAPGGTPTTSTCGLPGGTATVVIANPEITSLNVRDKPAGAILSTLPVGAQVDVVGGCGVKIAAGLVADAGGGAPPVPGWCAIASPMVGCVSEQFLVAGAQAPPVVAAGLVANPPQTAPAPAPPPVVEAPPVAAADQPTTSTCGLPGGAATVVIPDPAIAILNVRDRPAGTILTTIPRGAQVNVVGGCGVKIAAGLVAPAGGGQPPVPGWCAISSPTVGCVSEQFLMSGAQAPPVVAAGLVANPPQTAPAPQPPVAEAPPAQASAGGQAARLTQGANIRNGPGSKKTSVLESLPAGSIVTVLGCSSGWCQLAMPQYQAAWVFQDFLAFDVAAAPAPAPPVGAALDPGDLQAGDQQGGVAAAPPPVGEQNVTSTCGLPGGTATVVIADPAVTILNVRDKPAGTILNTIPKGSQVNVVGGCGVKIAAGLVANAPGAGPPPVPGWCAISSPMVGCVSEQFLAAGVPAPPVVAAGLVANPPQDAPAPQPPPPVADAPQAPASAGGQTARLKQGANIRSGPGSKKTSVLQSLPRGSTVTVLGCASGWCQLAMPQYREAWVFQDFLAFDGGGGQAPAPGIQVTINLGGLQGGGDQEGGDQQGGGEVAPPPLADGGEQPTTSTCGIAGGTATVVIPDPSVPVLNVRDKPSGEIVTTIPRDSQVNVVGGCGVKIAAGLVAQQGGGQPPVPGWCAISQPVVGCVSERFLVAGIPAGGQAAPAPAAGLVADQPQQAAAPTFTGTWNAEAQGASFTFNLTQDGKSVYGNYSGSDGSNGQIKGKLKGNVLRFAWRQTDNLSGAGKFALSGDGNSFSGSYTMGNDPDVAEGSWNGTRQ